MKLQLTRNSTAILVLIFALVFGLCLFFYVGDSYVSANAHDLILQGGAPNPGGGAPNPGGDSKLPDPLGDLTLTGFIEKLIDLVLLVMVPIVTLAFVYTGFLFVKGSVNPEAIKDAKKILLWLLVGTLLLFGAKAIMNALKDTIEEIAPNALINKMDPSLSEFSKDV